MSLSRMEQKEHSQNLQGPDAKVLAQSLFLHALPLAGIPS